jgi:RNA polymerase sigma-70 factor (ECF subfamily)
VPAQVDDLRRNSASLHARASTIRPAVPALACCDRALLVGGPARRTYRQQEDELHEDVVGADEEESIAARISLDRLLGFLPERQAHVIRLVKIDGHSITEAALRSGQ